MTCAASLPEVPGTTSVHCTLDDDIGSGKYWARTFICWGWGTFFSAKGYLDIYSIVHWPYKVNTFKISLSYIYWILSLTYSCLGRDGPNDFIASGPDILHHFPFNYHPFSTHQFFMEHTMKVRSTETENGRRLKATDFYPLLPLIFHQGQNFPEAPGTTYPNISLTKISGLLAKPGCQERLGSKYCISQLSKKETQKGMGWLFCIPDLTYLCWPPGCN